MQGGPVRGCVLVTGASGQIGTRVCDALRRSGHEVLAVDLNPDTGNEVEACDVRVDRQVARMFECGPMRAVIHLAAVLPTAFRAHPLAAAEVNLTGTLNVLRHAVRRPIGRVIFASSMSVYGSSPTSRALNEGDPATPDEGAVSCETINAMKTARTIEQLSVPYSAPSEFRCRRLQNLVGQRGIVDGARDDERADKSGHRDQCLLTSGGHRSAGDQLQPRVKPDAKPIGEGATDRPRLTRGVRSKRGYQTTRSGIVAMTGR